MPRFPTPLLTFASAVALALPSLPAVTAAQSPAATVDRAAEAWSRVRTARAAFVQTVSNPLTGGTATAQGQFALERPGRISIRFDEPSGDRIVSDGTTLWIYLPSVNPGQVVKRKASEGADALPIDFTAQFLEAPRRRFDVADGGTGAVDGAAAHAVVLTPKAGTSASFTRATVWVLDRDATVRQFEVTEPNGVTRRVHLTSLELNVPVAKDAFSFSVPKGARVVDGDAR